MFVKNSGIRRLLSIMASLCVCVSGIAQSVNPSMDALLRSREALALRSPVGTIEGLQAVYRGAWQLEPNDDEARYLDAVARGMLESGDAELRLLYFIEEHPHSNYINYARVALGNLYYSRGTYESAYYWLNQVDVDLLPEAMSASVEYHLAYTLMTRGKYNEALKLFIPLTYYAPLRNDATFYAGYLSLRNGDLEKGIHFLQDLQNDPVYGAYASAYIAEADLSELRYSEALERAERELSREGLPMEVCTSLLRTAGLASSSKGQAEQSVGYLMQYMVLEKGQKRLETLVLGEGLFELSRFREAEKYLLEVPNADPDFMGQLALYYAGLSELALKERSRAVASLDRAKAMNVYSPLTEVSEYNAALAVYSDTPGKLSDGTKRLSSFLQRFPNTEYRSQVISHLSDAFLYEPNVSSALKELNAISPLPTELQRVRDKVRLREANASLSSGNTALATQQYNDIIANSSDPLSVSEAYLWKGEAAYRAKNYPEAIRSTLEYIKRSESAFSVNHNAYYTLGYAYYNQGMYAEAERYFKKYQEVNASPSPEERTAIYNRLGDIELQRKAYVVAIEQYTRAEQAGGSEADYALFSKAMVKGLQGAYADKASFMSNLPIRYPQSTLVPESIYEQGRALSMQGDKKGAERAYDSFFVRFRSHPIAPKVGLQLALTYYSDNDLSRAIQAYEMVIRQYPNSPEAKSALQDLKSISVQMNRVENYRDLVREVGRSDVASAHELDSLTYLAAEQVVATGTTKEAEQALDKYLAEYPNGAFADNVYYNKALLLYNDKDYYGAISVVKDKARHFSGKLAEDTYRLLASSYDRTNEPGRAAEVYYQLALFASDNKNRSNWCMLSVERAEASRSDAFLISMAKNVKSGKLEITEEAKANVYLATTKVSAIENNKSVAIAYANEILSLRDYGGHPIAKIVLALDLYDRGDYQAVQRKMQEVVRTGTTDAYWLARAFILLSDSYQKLGDPDTARTYLESVKGSYSNRNDGIMQMINERLKQL